MCTINWDLVGKAISGALTLLFAGVVAYVAMQQWKLNERLERVSKEQLKVNSRQYRLALFEKAPCNLQRNIRPAG